MQDLTRNVEAVANMTDTNVAVVLAAQHTEDGLRRVVDRMGKAVSQYRI